MTFIVPAPLSAVPGPVGMAATALNMAATVEGIASNIFHHTAGAPQVGQGNKIDQARAARADAYLVGALVAGSVDSIRLALGAKQTNTSAAEQLLYAKVLAAMQSQAPTLYQQAQTAGALHDTASGLQGLQILLSAGVPFNDPWAGYSTANGSDLGDGAPAVATQLEQLAGHGAQGSTNLATTALVSAPATSATKSFLPNPSTSIGSTLGAGVSSPILILGLTGAVIVAMMAGRRRS